MKKTSAVLLLLVFLVSACSSAVEAPQPETLSEPCPEPEEPVEVLLPQADENGVVHLTKDYFIAHTEGIYANSNDYLGKTIHYEGFVHRFINPDTKEAAVNVLRFGPCY